jgi:hypothetical protein
MKALARCFIVFALFGTACDNAGTSTELTRPTTPPVSLSQFTGTLQVGATDSFNFNVAQDGYVQVTLLGLGAPANTRVDLAIGTPDLSGVCSTPIQTVTTGAGPSAQIIGTALAGKLCVSIKDVGNLTGPSIYTITVAAS